MLHITLVSFTKTLIKQAKAVSFKASDNKFHSDDAVRALSRHHSLLLKRSDDPIASPLSGAACWKHRELDLTVSLFAGETTLSHDQFTHSEAIGSMVSHLPKSVLVASEVSL